MQNMWISVALIAAVIIVGIIAGKRLSTQALSVVLFILLLAPLLFSLFGSSSSLRSSPLNGSFPSLRSLVSSFPSAFI